ncbi:hypothetical protein [Marinicella litoralis]|uniref:Bacterial repeat domain-containing protein n=1 Tax=Marinicella litoralis TaxID=644220 RepID=A0A4R6XLU9_9GAMM|nr:hypothetical protein [Marinicella litoralis]TDR20546.1 hypothetical protein C8D91_1520 [Marinicella litoralis]
MKTLQFNFIVLMLMLSSAAWSGLYWVGNSATCTGSNVYGTLDQALFVAALNGDPQDEIRLTNTVAYTGNGNGSYTLTDWSSTGAGVLTLVGGYTDCFGAVSGRTFVGDTANAIFEVNTNNESSSEVTFRNIQMSLTSATRAMVLSGGAVVTLDNVLVSSNQSGIVVSGGAFLDVLANSLIEFNGNTSNILGGGIYCTGQNSTVLLRGRVHRNQGLRGGNLHIRTGCYLEIKDGVRIEGRGTLAGLDAVEGAGLYVDNGGEVFADGRANRVIFDGNKAENGGAIYINGTSSFVLLQNTHINGSEAEDGSAIYANGGGNGTPQLIMDQTTDCNLLFRCSEIQNSRYLNSVVAVDDSMIQLQRTVIEQSDYLGTNLAAGLITSYTNSRVRLNRVGMIRNEAYAMLRFTTNDLFEVSHLTMADNSWTFDGSNSRVAVVLAGAINIQNSLITGSSGIDNRSAGASFAGGCNLIDNDFDWPSGFYHLGAAQLINPAAGDARQLAASPGVDMCLQDNFVWSSEIDIENQAAPVNENTNPQGMPGQSGGLYDAGFDEVYDNIGEDEFLLTVQKEGRGEGVVISNPSGISCGVDCSEVYFNGTIVTLFASPTAGNDFAGWLNCPLVNQDGECLTSVESSHTIRAVFQPDDLIYFDGFE